MLVGINLLREGLDIRRCPLWQYSMRTRRASLRAERTYTDDRQSRRNADGRVIMYADTVTGSMRRAIDETNRRREIQLRYNAEHGIVPKTIIKGVHSIIEIGKSPDGDEISPENRKGQKENVRGREEN